MSKPDFIKPKSVVLKQKKDNKLSRADREMSRRMGWGMLLGSNRYTCGERCLERYQRWLANADRVADYSVEVDVKQGDDIATVTHDKDSLTNLVEASDRFERAMIASRNALRASIRSLTSIDDVENVDVTSDSHWPDHDKDWSSDA